MGGAAGPRARGFDARLSSRALEHWGARWRPLMGGVPTVTVSTADEEVGVDVVAGTAGAGGQSGPSKAVEVTAT